MNHPSITLIEYLRMRHPTVNALTRSEAKVLGINYPLQSGWIESYTADIPHEVFCELQKKREERYASKSYKNAKSKAKKKSKAKHKKNHLVKGVADSRTK